MRRNCLAEGSGSRGAGERIRYVLGPFALGRLLVARSEWGLCALFFGDDADALRAELSAAFCRASLVEAEQELGELGERARAFVEDPGRGLDEPLDLRGTDFQKKVWAALREIPPGRRVTYTELARELELPSGVRAVAGACAANRLAVVIPCHRVVRLDGALAGYRWGLERKRWLLEQESKKRSAPSGLGL